MKVILLDELRGKGGEGDVIEVADGFANNWLFPQKIAIRATSGNLKQLEQQRAGIARREAVRIADAEKMREQLEGVTVRVEAKVGDEGQLFGSITAAQVAEALEAKGLEVDRKRIEIKPIKVVGVHPVNVALYRDIAATILVDDNEAAGFAAADAAAAEAAEEIEQVETEEVVEEEIAE